MGITPDTLIAVGRLTKPHGIKGEVVFLPYMYDLELLPDLTTHPVTLQHDASASQICTVTSWRQFHNKILLRLAHCHDLTQATALRGFEVLLPRLCFPPLPEGEFYWFEIEGLAVYAADGSWLGHIVEIIYTGSNDVYVVRHNADELLVPALKSVIRTIDVGRGEVHLYAVPDLLV
jgi:16S rRNA processing protein RimM